MQTYATWRGRWAIAAILLAGLIGFALLAMPGRSFAQASGVQIGPLTLSGAEEVPPVVGVNAVGQFSATVTSNSMTFDLSAVGQGLTMAHIHVGAKGTNGGVVAFLFGPTDPAVGGIHPTGTLTAANLIGPMAGNWDAFIAALAKGELYVNVHSVDHPAGVLRVQIPATTVAAPPVARAPGPPNTGTTANLESGSSQSIQIAGGLLLTLVVASSLMMVVSRKRAD